MIRKQRISIYDSNKAIWENRMEATKENERHTHKQKQTVPNRQTHRTIHIHAWPKLGR